MTDQNSSAGSIDLPAVPTTPNADEKRADSRYREVATVMLGIVLILFFVAFVVYMLGNLAIVETAWTRAMFLFGGVEAVAFAAAGYFFGTQVQRGKVQEAKAESEAATKVAKRADQVAEAERTTSTVLSEGIVKAAVAPQGGLLGD